MTQTKWINVNGNLYEGAIETVQNRDGSENEDYAIATVVIDGIRIRGIAPLCDCYDSPEAYYQYMLLYSREKLDLAKIYMSVQLNQRSEQVDRLDAEVKMWQSKLDLLKHES